MGIGGQLPPEMILDSFRRQFVAGLVLYLDCDFIKKPIRDKYILVACVNPVHLYLVINTDPPPFTRQDAELLACQILISVADHPFLEHDSHVNCLEAYEIDQDEVEQQILRDPRRIKGRLTPEAVQRVRDAIQESPSLEIRDQNWITNGLVPYF